MLKTHLFYHQSGALFRVCYGTVCEESTNLQAWHSILAEVPQTAGFGLDSRGSTHGRDTDCILLSTGAHIQCVPETPPGTKRPGRKADRSPPSSTEVRSVGIRLHLPLKFNKFHTPEEHFLATADLLSQSTGPSYSKIT